MTGIVTDSNYVVTLLREAQFPVTRCWNQLGCDLGVPLEERRRLRQSALISLDYWSPLEECIDWWQRNDNNPTWTKLLNVIGKADLKAADMMRIELSKDSRYRSQPLAVAETVNHMKPICAPQDTKSTDVKAQSAVSANKCRIFMIVLLITCIIICWFMSSMGVASVVTTITAVTCIYCFCNFKIKADNEISTSKHKANIVENTNEPDDESSIWVAGETGNFVVKKCIEKLEMLTELEVFPDDKKFMERTALVMSRNGKASFVLHNDGGIWQVSQYAFEDTKDELEHVRLPRKYQKLQDVLGIKDWRKVTRTDLEKPMYSALAARLYLSNFAEAIPPAFDIDKQQEYWWRFYMLKHEARKYMQENDYKTAVNLMRNTS